MIAPALAYYIVRPLISQATVPLITYETTGAFWAFAVVFGHNSG